MVEAHQRFFQPQQINLQIIILHDNTISGNKLQSLTVPGSKLANGAITNSKVGFGISGSKFSNIPESSLANAVTTKLNSPEVQIGTGELNGNKITDNTITESKLAAAVRTKLNASGGGGGASVATQSQFNTGSDTLAPSVNQTKSYADSKDAFLVLWEGQFGNASADNVTTIGNKATISGLNEYDATNDRQTITKGGGAGNNTLIEWENPNIDARRATFLSELTMNDANWTMSAQIGYTSLVAGDNALEVQQGGWGFLCTRSTPIIGSNAGIFGISLFVGQGGSLGSTVSPREMASSQIELRGGALAPNGNNPYVRLPYDTDADKVVLHVERIGRLFRVYTDGILRMIVSLNDAQAAVPGNSGKFGYAGNPANTPSIRYYISKAAVGNTVIRPLSGAGGGGSATIPDGSIATAKLANNAVTGPKIASNAVITTKIANGAVTGPKLDANSVDTTKIFNGSVTEAKLATAVQTKLNASGDIDFPSIPTVSSLKDGDELVLNSTVTGSVTLTAGDIFGNSNGFGWGRGRGGVGSISKDPPSQIAAIFYSTGDSSYKVYSQTVVDEIIVEGVSFPLTRSSSTASYNGSSYRIYTTQLNIQGSSFVNNQQYQVKVLNGGSGVVEGEPEGKDIKKITLRQLKTFLGIS